MRSEKTAPRLVSGKAAKWIVAILLFYLVTTGGLLLLASIAETIPEERQETNFCSAPATSTATKVDDEVLDLSWNGTPKYGYTVSDVLDMSIGDRIEIFWTGGGLRPLPKEYCYGPGGSFGVASENKHLFWYSGYGERAFALYVIHGNAKRVWLGDEDRIVVRISGMPVRFYFNTLVKPGIYYSNAMQSSIPIDGYTAPWGRMTFRIVNRK